MKFFSAPKLLIALVLAQATLSSPAAEPYADIHNLRLGRPDPAIVAIQTEIASADAVQLREIETKLAAILRSTEATADAKAWVCRTLRFAGSSLSVSALAPLLTDPQLAADAQFALRSIPGPEPDRALRAALSHTQGLLKAGVLQTLGARGDRESVPAMAPSLLDSDPRVVECCLYALGHIGGEPALRSLQQAKVSPGLEGYRQHAVVLCAESLLVDGKAKPAAAALHDIYKSSKDPDARAAALHGIVLFDGSAAEKPLAQALSSESGALRSAAARFLCELAPSPVFSRILADFKAWVPDLQICVLNLVTNPAALPVAKASIQDSDPQVRAAACLAVGRIGGAAEIPSLLQSATSNEPVRTAARSALVDLRGKTVETAMISSAKSESAAAQAEIARALAARNYAPALPFLFELAKADTVAAPSAFQAIGQLASPAELNSLIELLAGSTSEPQRDAAEAAIANLLERSTNKPAAEVCLSAAISGKSAPAQCALLRSLARVPGQKGLEALRAASRSTNPVVKDTAVRCLADWPDESAIQDLLDIARQDEPPQHRKMALRGFLRLATTPGAHSPAEAVKLVGEALKLSRDQYDKRGVLAALAGIRHPDALRLALSCLNDPGVEVECASAVVSLARQLQASEPDTAASAIQKLLDSCKTAVARQLAESAGVIMGDMINIASRGTATSPDGLDKDGEASGDQAAIDGNPATYWDEQDGEKLYRLVVTFKQPETVSALSISGYAQHNFAPKDFAVLCDGELVKTIESAQYADNLLVVPLPQKSCRAIELKINICYGSSPAIRELGIYQQKPRGGAGFRVLVFSKTLGFRHANIPLGVSAIRQLGAEHSFAVDATEDSSAFTPENLARYKSVVFLSATGDILNPDQEKALMEYVLGGGGFAAIHGALFGPSACEDKWGWYGDLCCVSFKNHSAVVPAHVDIEDPHNPSTADLPQRWLRTDEWYNYDGTPRGKARVLATIDESSYAGGAVGPDHPIAWCKPAGKGVMWYTAMGHTDESFREPLFLKHLLGGIELTAGVKTADLSPNQKPARP